MAWLILQPKSLSFRTTLKVFLNCLLEFSVTEKWWLRVLSQTAGMCLVLLFCLALLGLSCGVQVIHCIMWLSRCGSGYGSWALEGVGSAVAVCWLSCSSACRIFLDQGLNLCPMNWQADSQPPDKQGSPQTAGFVTKLRFVCCSVANTESSVGQKEK